MIGYIECHIALRRSKHSSRKNSKSSNSPFSTPAAFRAGREWLESMPQESVFMQSHDCLRLHARLIINPEHPRRFAILCHGYKATSGSMAVFARLFYEEGFSVLIPDARAHAKSEGRYIGMGFIERKDILNWIQFLNDRFNTPYILLFGVSMGGATIMNTVGEDLPANVFCAIEDCGFSSVYDLFVEQLRIRNIPPFLLYPADPFCRILAGFSIIDRCHIIDSLSKCRIPMLFIHGTADTFVLPEHMERAFIACTSQKKCLRVMGAGHADSILADPDTYRAAIHRHIYENLPT